MLNFEFFGSTSALQSATVYILLEVAVSRFTVELFWWNMVLSCRVVFLAELSS